MSNPSSSHADRPSPSGPFEAIDVGISRGHLLAGRILMGTIYASYLLFMWLNVTGRLPFDVLGMTMIAVALFLTLTFMLPLVIGRWPSFVVRIYGRRFLLRTLEQFREGLGKRRPIRAKLAEPDTWLHDARVVTALILLAMFLLGWAGS